MREDYRDLIQEWFAECCSAEEIAELYADLMHEAKFQMQYMLSQYKLKDDE